LRQAPFPLPISQPAAGPIWVSSCWSGGGARIVGTPPRREEGHWRVGFIVLLVPPKNSLGLRWLH
jgi:hypothetical protein